ncbi:MAG: type III-B CRISPR module RAMP protein Cmr6 [Eubacteriaceae bacterium]|nr:type III-B CRISPR module RAMP protein Cmr6 [Eubacteriaceae bacterium]
MSNNIGFLYTRDLYRFFDGETLHETMPGDGFFNTNLVRKYNKIFNSQIANEIPQNPLKTHSVFLKTLYPGLLVGIGSMHGFDKQDIDTRNGFSFEYTSGQPFIPGSSVKGALRSAFCDKADYLLDLDFMEKQFTDNGNEQLEACAKEIFENSSDIFYDAYPVQADPGCRLMCEDYITSHLEEFKEPIPIRIIKVGPGITFRFDFRLSDCGKMKAETKKELFTQILIDWGIGAKTNTGYGNFTKTDNIQQ